MTTDKDRIKAMMQSGVSEKDAQYTVDSIPVCDTCKTVIPPSQMFDRRELYRGNNDPRHCDDCIADAWMIVNFGEDGLH